MSIIELRESRKSNVESAQAILDAAEAADRDLTPAEAKKFDNHCTRAEELTTAIERREKLAEHHAEASALVPRRAPPIFDPTGAANDPVFHMRRPGQLRAFANTRDGREDAHKAGKWLQATILGDRRAETWCRDRGIEVDFRAAHSEGVNTAGGALVPSELDRVIISLRESYGIFRQNSRVVSMGSDSLSIPRRSGGLTAYFVGENTEGTESDTAWDNVSLSAKKLMCLSRMSSELSEDSIISVADMLADEVALAFATKEDGCGFNGDGTSTYGGVNGIVTQLNAGVGTLAGCVDATSTHDTLAEVTLADLMYVVGTLPTYALRGAKWYTSQYGWATIFQAISAAGGGNTIQTLSGMVGPAFLGYPVVVSQSLPSTGTLNNQVMLMFGDLALASTMGDRRGIRFRLSEDRYWELDQIGVKGTERFDIINHDIGDNTTAGPVVALIGNT